MEKYYIIFIVIIVVLFIALLSNFYYFNQQLGSLKNRNILVSQNQASQIIDRLSKIYDVPTDETPTIVDINEPEKLRNQPFFAKAQAGDELFIYLKNQKAILYDPVNNKIINVDNANVAQSNNQNVSSPSAGK